MHSENPSFCGSYHGQGEPWISIFQGGMWCWRSRRLVSSCSWRESGWQHKATLVPSSISTGLMGVNPRMVSFVFCSCRRSSFVFPWGLGPCRRLNNKTNALILVLNLAQNQLWTSGFAKNWRFTRLWGTFQAKINGKIHVQSKEQANITNFNITEN